MYLASHSVAIGGVVCALLVLSTNFAGSCTYTPRRRADDPRDGGYGGGAAGAAAGRTAAADGVGASGEGESWRSWMSLME